MTFYNIQRYAKVSCTGNFPPVKKQIENSHFAKWQRGNGQSNLPIAS